MGARQYKLLNRFFSKQTLKELMTTGKNELYHHCVKTLLKKDQFNFQNNITIIKQLYTICEEFYRNEYYYKNIIINKLLLGRHSLNTTVALTETPIERSKADFILINGKATVYEIKTEIDNLERLNSQIENYYKAFDTVNVVTYEGNEQQLAKKLINKDVGIIVLNRKNHLSERKPAKINPKNLSNESIYKILRKNEIENILQFYFGKLPVTNPINHYRECLKLAKKIDTKHFYQLFLIELKKRNISHHAEFLEVPYEIKYPIYFSKLNKYDYLRLEEFLTTNYGG